MLFSVPESHWYTTLHLVVLSPGRVLLAVKMSETFLVCDHLDSFEDYWSIVSRMSLNWDNLSDVFLMIKLGL